MGHSFGEIINMAAQGYKPKTIVPNKDTLQRAHEQLEPYERAIIDDQADRIDQTALAIKTAKNRGKIVNTGLGKVSRLELMAMLGIWLRDMCDNDPDEWNRLLKSRKR